MLHDILYAIRGFRRAPGVALTVIVTIGLALGLNTTMFTIFNAYVLRPFDVRDPYSLYTLAWATKGRQRSLSFTEYQQLRTQASGLDGVVLTENLIATVDGQPLVGQRASGDYFTMLGVGAAMGRPLMEDDAQGMVLSYGAWTAKFASDPHILGRSFPVMGKSYTVVGVARRGFEGVSPAAIDFWIPLATDHPPQLQGVLVRLKPRAALREVQAELTVVAARITADRPADQRATGVVLVSNATPLSLNKGANYILFAPVFVAFGLVLVIACANVANMLLARAAGRQKEMGVRLALGAGRARIIRQLLVESAVLAVPAALAGFAVARVSIRTSLQLYFATAPGVLGKLIRILPLDPDVRVFGFLLAASLAATLAFGLAPAIQAARGDIAAAARGESGGFRPSRLRHALLVSQVAVCALLLIVAGVLLRGSAALQSHDRGVATRNVVYLNLQTSSAARIVEKLKLEPWAVESAASSRIPLSGYRTVGIGPANAATIRSGYNFVTPEYFALLRIGVVRGRTFTLEESTAEAPVAIVSEKTARQFWPGRNPIGEVIRIEPQPLVDRGELPAFHRAQIVGVVRDVTTGDISDSPDPTMFYFPTNPHSANALAVLVRIKEDTEATRRALNDLVERVAPGSTRLAISLDEMFTIELFPFRLSFAIAAFLGVLALVLAIAGVYGVLSYLVAQRTREIGIRMALGASSGSVVRLILAQSTRFALWGIGIGVLLALGVSRIFASLLEEINTYEPLAYAAAIAAVLAAALAASLVPSQRGARIDPASTLRYD